MLVLQAVLENSLLSGRQILYAAGSSIWLKFALLCFFLILHISELQSKQDEISKMAFYPLHYVYRYITGKQLFAVKCKILVFVDHDICKPIFHPGLNILIIRDDNWLSPM